MREETWPDFLLNAPVLFGLVQQGHIQTIERMVKEGTSWDEIGKEIGWDTETVKEHYGWYLDVRKKEENGR
jgi:hypothetical protein